MIGYCVKCRAKKEMLKSTNVKVKGRNAVKGICSKCGTNMFKFVK